MKNESLVVIGGGAAGFFCAVNAARLNPALSVTILEKTSEVLSKVKVSGGWRCNVTHACSHISDMARNYPRGNAFLKKAFHHFFVDDTVNWFESRGVRLKTEADGRMFPETDDSATVINCFLSESEKYKVKLKFRSGVKSIHHAGGRFSIETAAESMTAEKICLAAGGIGKPEQAAWLNKLGHSLVKPVPSLFTFNIPDKGLRALMGISLQEATVRIDDLKISETGPLLITHWGLSGPAVIKLSAWGARELNDKNYRFRISVNWAPSFHERSMLDRLRILRFEKAAAHTGNHPPLSLPARLWHHLLSEAGIAVDTRWADVPAREQNKLARILCGSQYDVVGKTTFKEEFVTAGGISLAEVDPSTMESRKVPGLYFAGEMLDIDGVTGGFNFQACWTTAYIAARAIAGRDAKE